MGLTHNFGAGIFGPSSFEPEKKNAILTCIFYLTLNKKKSVDLTMEY
jgi:hypothetical protein